MLLPSIPTKMNPQLFEDPQSNNSDSSNDNESDNDSIGSSSQSQEDEAAAGEGEGEGEVKPVEKQLPTDSKALLDRRRLFESLKKRREDSVTPLPIGQVGSKTKPMKKQKRVRKPKINPPGNATARPPTTQPRSLPAPREPQRKPMPYLHRVATDPETLDDVTTVRIDLSQQEPLYQGLSKSSVCFLPVVCQRSFEKDIRGAISAGDLEKANELSGHLAAYLEDQKRLKMAEILHASNHASGRTGKKKKPPKLKWGYVET